MLIQIVLGIVIVGAILYRQTKPRPLGDSPRAALIITAIGAFGALKFLQHNDVSVLDAGLLIVSTVVGIALSLARAYTVVIYRDPATGAGMSKGTTATLMLWVAAIAAHFGIDALASSAIGGSTLLFYIGLVLLVQNVVVHHRAARLEITAPASVKV